MRAADFSAAFAAASGASLTYVVFTPPAKPAEPCTTTTACRQKTGTSVAASAKYYTGTSPIFPISPLCPQPTTRGRYIIAYKAYDPAGNFFAGTLTIQVQSAQGGIVVYMTDKNADRRFDAAGFFARFYERHGKGALLCQIYAAVLVLRQALLQREPFSGYRSALSASVKYSVNSSPYLSYISFVPHDDYNRYRCYELYRLRQGRHRLQRQARSARGGQSGRHRSYEAKVGETVRLSGSDFAEEFITVTGSVALLRAVYAAAQGQGHPVQRLLLGDREGHRRDRVHEIL